MNTEQSQRDMATIELVLVRETAQAVMLAIPGRRERAQWVPKCFIGARQAQPQAGKAQTVLIEIDRNIARQKGLLAERDSGTKDMFGRV